MEQVKGINQDLPLYLEKNTTNAGIKSLKRKRITMSKEKSNVLTALGIIVKDDSGGLFITAVIVFILSAITLYFYRKDIPFLSKP